MPDFRLIYTQTLSDERSSHWDEKPARSYDFLCWHPENNIRPGVCPTSGQIAFVSPAIVTAGPLSGPKPTTPTPTSPKISPDRHKSPSAEVFCALIRARLGVPQPKRASPRRASQPRELRKSSPAATLFPAQTAESLSCQIVDNKYSRSIYTWPAEAMNRFFIPEYDFL